MQSYLIVALHFFCSRSENQKAEYNQIAFGLFYLLNSLFIRRFNFHWNFIGRLIRRKSCRVQGSRIYS